MDARKNPRVLVAAACAIWPLVAFAFHSGCSSDSPNEGHDAGWDRGIIPPPPPPQSEAGPETSSTTDGGTCDLSKAFGEALPVPGLDGNIDIARLTADESTIYFNTFEDTAHRNLKFAKRRDLQSPFGTAEPLSQLNSADNDTAATISGDDKVIVYSSNRGDGWWRLFWAQRSDPSLPFGAPAEVTGFNLARSSLTDPALFSGPEGLELWFRSDGTGNGDIYRSLFKNGVVTSAVPQSALNTEGANDLLPVMSPDRLTVYFGSNRPGYGGFDIWAARRPTPNDAFISVTTVKELNTDKDEWPTWMSVDGCRMYLTSTRGGLQATYMAERPK